MKDYYVFDESQMLAVWLLQQCAYQKVHGVRLSNQFLRKWLNKESIYEKTANSFIASMEPIFSYGRIVDSEGARMVELHLKSTKIISKTFLLEVAPTFEEVEQVIKLIKKIGPIKALS